VKVEGCAAKFGGLNTLFDYVQKTKIIRRKIDRSGNENSTNLFVEGVGMLKFRWFLLPVFLFSFGLTINANVIDFETGSFVRGFGQTGISEGFSFTTGGQSSSVITVPVNPTNCSPNCISDGTLTLGAFNGATVTIDPIIPGAFNLESFDVAGTAATGSNRNATSIRVIGNLFGGGQVAQMFSIDPTAFQTVTLNSSFVNLSSAEFDGLQPVGLNSPEFQLDNIVYTTASTVPEPTSLALLATVLIASVLVTVGRKLVRSGTAS
jgi:hypothetical protein